MNINISFGSSLEVKNKIYLVRMSITNVLSKNLHLFMRDQRISKQNVVMMNHRNLPDIFLKMFDAKKLYLPTFDIMVKIAIFSL